ncbi:MAG TPA: hypothetical protein DD434_01030 [Bacteroidales bacterium]|nr:hypothetical protein [Bacteroidales bacterium]
MSADNGVYILKTADGQYRVKEFSAIDNLNWSFIHFRPEHYVPTRILEYFGNCKHTYNRDTALNIAQNIYNHLHVCEYGIQTIPINRTWNRIKHDSIDYARQEIKSLNDNNVDGRYNAEAKKLEETLKYLTIWQTRYHDVKGKPILYKHKNEG